MTFEELDDLGEGVETYKDLAKFIAVLGKAMRERPDEFENRSLDTYLDALWGFTSALDGYHFHQKLDMPAQPSWKLVARMLMAATIYE